MLKQNSNISDLQPFGIVCSRSPVPRGRGRNDRKLKPGGWGEGARHLWRCQEPSILSRSTRFPRVTPLRVLPVCVGDPARPRGFQKLFFLLFLIDCWHLYIKYIPINRHFPKAFQPQGVYLKPEKCKLGALFTLHMGTRPSSSPSGAAKNGLERPGTPPAPSAGRETDGKQASPLAFSLVMKKSAVSTPRPTRRPLPLAAPTPPHPCQGAPPPPAPRPFPKLPGPLPPASIMPLIGGHSLHPHPLLSAAALGILPPCCPQHLCSALSGPFLAFCFHF